MPPFFGSKNVLKGLGCSSLSDLAKHARDPGSGLVPKRKRKIERQEAREGGRIEGKRKKEVVVKE